jgi:hypothetical protein
MKFRKKDHVLAEIERLTAIVWYHRCSTRMVESGEIDELEPKHRADCLAARKRVQEQYPEVLDWEGDDFDWGMINGKLSALRWATGDDWDMLDT